MKLKKFLKQFSLNDSILINRLAAGEKPRPIRDECKKADLTLGVLEEYKDCQVAWFTSVLTADSKRVLTKIYIKPIRQ